MPTAVVTGGAGFLGSHLCEYLLERDYRVLCVDNLVTSSPTNIEHLRDGRAIPTFIRQALEDAPITVFGEGQQTRSFCYVDDLIRGIHLLAMSGEHLPVNIGNPSEFTILELAQTVIRVTSSKSEIVFEALPIDDPQVRQPDISRAREVLGWEPEIPLEEGLRRMLPAGTKEAMSV